MTTTRSYSSPLRAADAAATRARIVDAAAELFVRDGFAATTLKSIAERAGVSVQSVNLAGHKRALLMAAFEKTFAGDEGQHSLSERPDMAAIMTDSDTGRAAARYVDFIVEANARAAGIWRVLHVAADGDAELRAQVDALDERRRTDLRIAAGWMAERGLIAPSELTTTADQLAYLTSADAYLHFVEAAGWSKERYGGWLISGIRALMQPPTPS